MTLQKQVSLQFIFCLVKFKLPFFLLDFGCLECFTKYAGMIWKDVLLMDEVLHEAVLSEFSLEVFLQTDIIKLMS